MPLHVPPSEFPAIDPLAPDALERAWALLVGPAPDKDTAAALAAALRDLKVPDQGPGKLATAAVSVAMAHALGRADGPLPQLPGLRKRLGTGDGAFVQPLVQALLARALGGGASGPDHGAELLAALEELREVGTPKRIDERPFEIAPPDAWHYLAALAFCRSGEAWTSCLHGHPCFTTIHPDRWSTVTGGLDEVERATMAEALRVYIEESTTLVFPYGLWRGAAEQAASAVTNREAIAPWLGEAGSLRADPPTLDRLTLTRSQADWLLATLDRVRDARAARAFVAGLAEAMSPFEGLPQVAPGHLPPAAFALFQRVHELFRNRAEGSSDGRLDYRDLESEVRQAAGDLGPKVRAALVGLRERPPRIGAVALPEEAVPWLEALLLERVRSGRAVANIEEATLVWALGGRVPDEAPGPQQLDAAAFADLRTFLESYLSHWPSLQVFDFNKLGRLALAARTGDPTPLCRINGAEVDPGDFHVEVGEAVRLALEGIAFPQAWIPRRFGYRARQCIELVDLLAEQAGKGLGPLPTLSGKVCVVATTSDMSYNLMVFGEVDARGTERWLYLDSTGQLSERRRPEDKHRLFTAWVDPSGHIDVEIPARLSLSIRAWPVMNPYGLGDMIDVEYFAEDVAENQTETERFQTRYQVRHGTIVAYDPVGNHQVELLLDGGRTETRVATHNQIRDWNNPHYVQERGGSECSMRFDLDRDKRWAEDLAEVEAIARRTGLLDFPLSWSEVELARTQKAFLKELDRYCSSTMQYPREPPVDEKDHLFHDKLEDGTWPAGDYLAAERGVCRHQFIRSHMAKQRAGIDERFASGAANTYAGDFRGLHIWGEVMLADRARLAMDNPEPRDTRYLSDPTWNDPYIPLWSGAYGNDQRRIEMYNRTSYRSNLVVEG